MLFCQDVVFDENKLLEKHYRGISPKLIGKQIPKQQPQIKLSKQKDIKGKTSLRIKDPDPKYMTGQIVVRLPFTRNSG